MAILLLVIIYIIFISLGLPDGVFGSAWPAIHTSLGAPAGLGGFLTVVITLMTIVSSLSAAYMIRRLGIGLLIAISTALTALALIGYANVENVAWLFILAVPFGLGAGAIDTALNNYVATHYKAHHMNWLHGFWGVGATLGPLIFAATLISTGDWHDGFMRLGLIQLAIVLLILFSLGLWGRVKAKKPDRGAETIEYQESSAKLLGDKNVALAVLSFYLYVGIEVAIGFWLASYLVSIQNLPHETAAIYAGLYYAAITAGRFLTGFLSFKSSNIVVIRLGIIVSIIGVLLLILNISPTISAVGIGLIGLGFAPVYPGLIHETPNRVGTRKSARVMGLQMAAGGLGAMSVPPLIGVLSESFSFMAFGYVSLTLVVLILLVTEAANRAYNNPYK